MALASFFQAKRFRPFRASLFIAFGGWGVVPAVHAAILHWGNWHMMLALKHSVVMGIVYVVCPCTLLLYRNQCRWHGLDRAHQPALFHAGRSDAASVFCCSDASETW